MRNLSTALFACALLAATVGPVAASGPATRGFLPAEARPHGHSLVELATAWNHWAWSTPAETNPLLAVRCEQSPVDPMIWFLPVSLGGEWEATCEVPQGAVLLMLPGGWECSSIEPDPWFGGNEAELRACTDAGFDLLSYVEVTLDGRATTDLADYVLTTDLDTLPPDNLLGPDGGLTMSKGYFMAIAPLSRGEHILRAYDEFGSIGFQAGITYTIIVG